MAAEWLLSALIIATATPTFGHFETVRPTWTRSLRWFAYLAVTGALGVTVGRPWTLIWVLGLPTVGAVFDVIWCLRLLPPGRMSSSTPVRILLACGWTCSRG
ncbi:MAG TPA: hypothetical protein VHR39_19770 [Propionibacteriaceae bacterium]|nr:hypothetical protein [Propionibacteriaceae bacterium]